MADFFARDCTLSVGCYNPETPRIRANAYATVGGVLGTGLKGFDDTWKGTRKAAPTLESVSVTLEGKAGCLRRCEYSFTCYDKASFDELEAKLLLPGKEVNITYGYVDDKVTNKTSGDYTFTIYDYSFDITKENYFKCKAKGVGKGMTFEEENMNAVGVFPNDKFVTNYAGFNETAKAANMFDYIDAKIQKGEGLANAKKFNPPNGAVGSLHGGQYGILSAPTEYEPETGKLQTGATADRLIYINLKALIGIVNQFFLKGFGYKLAFDSEYSKIATKQSNRKIFSADPTRMLFPYSTCQENSYPHKKSEKGKGKSGKNALNMYGNRTFITANDFKSGLSRMSNTNPGAILLSRDFLREIQKSFSDAAKDEKANAEKEEMTTGGITIRQLFNKVFAGIRENSGGAWDFYLEQDDEAEDPGRSNIYIVNRKCPSDGKPSMCDLTPDGSRLGIRELKISGKVPKAFQAKFAGGAPDTGPSPEEVAKKEVNNEDAPAAGKVPTNDELREIRMKISTSEYDPSAISAAKAALKSLCENQSGTKKIENGQIPNGTDFKDTPFPMEFSATIDGHDGFTFGHTLKSDYLPSRYGGKDNANAVCFTVTDLEHSISGNDWQTTLNAIMRLR